LAKEGDGGECSWEWHIAWALIVDDMSGGLESFGVWKLHIALTLIKQDKQVISMSACTKLLPARQQKLQIKTPFHLQLFSLFSHKKVST
jgi:hypothetical protein